MGTKSATESDQGLRMRSLAVILLIFSSGVLADFECWYGSCGTGDGDDACADDTCPSLRNVTCASKKCSKSTGYIGDSLIREFACAGESDGLGCSEPDMEGATDVELCVCDTNLCNGASKQAFASLFAFVLFFLAAVIM